MAKPLPIQARPPLRGGIDAVATEGPLAGVDWRQGVIITPTTNDGVGVWNADCRDIGYSIDGEQFPDNEKPAGLLPNPYEFAPFIIESHVECNVGGTKTVIGDIIKQNAVISLETMTPRVIAKVLQGTIPVHTAPDRLDLANPTLNNPAVLPSGFNPMAPGNLKGTLQGLLDQVCGCAAGEMTFHVPESFLPYFLINGVVSWDEGSGTYRFGAHAVSFDCYPNQGPPDVELASPTLTDGTECWIWISNPIWVATAPLEDWTVQHIHTRTNTASAIVERAAIVAFDPSCTAAAKAKVA